MANNKFNGFLDYSNLKSSQYGGSQAIGMSFSELQSGLRIYSTNTILKDAYTHFIQTSNDEGLPSHVEYWQAVKPRIDKLTLVGDSSGSLAGTYVTLEEYLTKRSVVLYCVVSGNGSAPGVGDLEVPVIFEENDTSSIVTYAFLNAINNNLDYFKAERVGSIASTNELRVTFLQLGEADSIDVGSTGFSVTTEQQGESFKVGEIFLDYDADNNPIFNGNTLKGLLYNPYTASFDIERQSVEVSTIVDLKRPSGFDVTEISIPDAGVETAIVLPDDTKRFKIQAREANTELQITNSESGEYFTIRYGCHYEENGLETSGVTLYVTTSRDDRTIELLTWS